MARGKRIVLKGPAAEAVELLAQSAGVSPAELVKRALLREDEAQTAERNAGHKQTRTAHGIVPDVKRAEPVDGSVSPEQLYVIYLDANDVIRFHTVSEGAIYRQIPRPSADDFEGLITYVMHRPAILERFVDPDKLPIWAPDPDNQGIAAFVSRAPFNAIKSVIDHYLSIAGFVDEAEVTEMPGTVAEPDSTVEVADEG